MTRVTRVPLIHSGLSGDDMDADGFWGQPGVVPGLGAAAEDIQTEQPFGLLISSKVSRLQAQV